MVMGTAQRKHQGVGPRPQPDRDSARQMSRFDREVVEIAGRLSRPAPKPIEGLFNRRPFQLSQLKLSACAVVRPIPSSPRRSLTPGCLIYNQPIGRNENRMRLFPMNSGQARMRLVQGGAVFATVALIAGCGAGYRPVVTPITPSGPAAQPSSFAVVVSAPSPTTPGIASIVDYSGDSLLAFAPIGNGPVTFTIDALGANGYTVNSDGTLSNFPISSMLQAKLVDASTLPSTANPVNLFSPSAGLYAADLTGNQTDVFSGSPEAFKLSIPVTSTPVMVVGPSTVAQRQFTLSQNIPGATGMECNTAPTAQPTGSADGIELSTFTLSSNISVGKCPVYGVESSDNSRPDDCIASSES